MHTEIFVVLAVFASLASLCGVFLVTPDIAQTWQSTWPYSFAFTLTAGDVGLWMWWIKSSRMRAVAERVGAIEKQYNEAMWPNAKPWSGLTDQTIAQLQKYANDKLPARMQARGADGQPLAPATVDNGFAWKGTTGPHSSSLLDQARQHPGLAGLGAAGAGIALGSAPAWAPAVAAVGGGSALARALALGAGYGVARKYLP
jgi:hypothetical protein